MDAEPTQHMHIRAVLSVIAALAISGGCTGRTGPEIGRRPARSIFTAGPWSVRVIFNPASGRPAQGATDADGRFQLSTLRAGDGAVVGMHRVVVIGARSQAEPMPGDNTPPPAAAASDLPVQYANPQTSGLEYAVKSGTKNEFVLRLE